MPKNCRVTGTARLIQVIVRAWELTNAQTSSLLAYRNEAASALLDGGMTFAGDDDRADRLTILYSIHSSLADLFVEKKDEARWIRDRLPILENLSPLDYMLENQIPGMLRVQELVQRQMAHR